MQEPREQSTPATAVTVQRNSAQLPSAFSNIATFESAQRMAQALAASDLVPESYRGNVANCLVALEIAQRCQASPLMVAQNLNLIDGRPSWSSPYIISAINSCGRFEPLNYDVKELGEKTVEYTYWEGLKGQRQKKTGSVKILDKVCIAWTIARDGKRLESPPVSIEMAVQEGWYTRSGSKWKTMPDLMLRYRAAAFFGRLYTPEILMGMRTAEEEREVIDVTPERVETVSNIRTTLNEKVKAAAAESAPAASASPGAPDAESVEAEVLDGEEYGL